MSAPILDRLAEDDESPTIEVSLLNGFEMRVDGHARSLPPSAQRLVAFLALQPRPRPRSFVAASLWLDATDERAAASLRSALWRLRGTGHPILESSGSTLGLRPGVRVDVAEFVALADAIVYGVERVLGVGRVSHLAVLRGSGELLPGWYEDWVSLERERLRQLRQHALERLCVELTHEGHPGLAVQAGLAAISEDPYRESAHRALILAHLADGNQAQALRHYSAFEAHLRRDLGLEPSERLREVLPRRLLVLPEAVLSR